MLTLDGLTKSFGTRRVLDGLDLEVDAGESVALLGSNGSGKTTTLRCVVGLARPDAGTIAIGGVDIAADGIAARRKVSYLPQKSAFPATLTVRETLALVARLRRRPPAAVDREIEWCGLTALADRGVGHLSGGERQRLAMAVAFVPDADVYLFDEPSTNLDLPALAILFRRMRALHEEGRTLVFTTHVPSDVHRLATRVVWLHEGRLESDRAGAFELRRYERMLEQDRWGDDHESLLARDDRDDRRPDDGGLLRAGANARAGAARPR